MLTGLQAESQSASLQRGRGVERRQGHAPIPSASLSLGHWAISCVCVRRRKNICSSTKNRSSPT